MQRSGSTISKASSRHISLYNSKESVKVIQNKEYQRTKAVWPDANGINPPDWRLSMPGNIGLLSDQQRDLTKNIDLGEFLSAAKDFYIEKKISSTQLDAAYDLSERAHKSISDATVQAQIELENCSVSGLKQTFGLSPVDQDEALEKVRTSLRQLSSKSETEFSYHEVPELLESDMNQIFIKDWGTQIGYDKKMNSDKIVFKNGEQKISTIMSVCIRTENSMAGWNAEVQLERLEKMDKFIEVAQEVAFLLIENGYFCDFIDPTTGRPWFSNKENSSADLQVLETNEHFDGLGNLEIEDLGCCKVLAHKNFGLKCFVGTLVSNCPTDHPILAKLQQI